MKLIVLIISSQNPIYDQFKECWMSYMHKYNNIQSFFVVNDPNLNYEITCENDILTCKGNETTIPGIFYKTISTMKYINEHYKYDFILRTNLSSFYIFSRLMEFLKSCSISNYAGAYLGNENGIPFLSGAGMIFSKDICEKVVSGAELFPLPITLNDDLLISFILHQYKVPFHKLQRYDFIHNHFSGNETIDESIFHIRIKNESNRNLDIHIYKYLLNKYYENFEITVKNFTSDIPCLKWEIEDVITSDKYLSFANKNNDLIKYIKTDVLLFGPMNWRGNYHYFSPCKIWITGHSDYGITKEIFENFNMQCETWFSINKECDCKVISLPLGITNNTQESHLHPIYGNVQIMKTIYEEPICEFENIVYMNINIDSHSERKEVYDLFYNQPWVTKENAISTFKGREHFLRKIRKHIFVIAPRGNGLDTHRLWETLYLGRIPIVKRHVGLEEFNDLPICFVEDWSQVNLSFLHHEYLRICNKQWNFEKLKIDYWTKLMSNYL